MLTNYVQKFTKLTTGKGNQWPQYPQTKYQAPHKPLLLLAVMDLFAEGAITTNLIELDHQLGELFTIYWAKVIPPERRRGNIAMPFFHLKNEKFWHLMLRPGKQIISKIHSVSKLKETIFGARLDDELYDLFCSEDTRNALRNVLTETYFAPNIQEILIQQGDINLKSYLYSRDLLEQARKEIKEISVDYVEEAVRDQGFRRVIRESYDYRCAMTGLRVITADGHIAVIGAHIKPWGISHNDNPRNGISLSPTCHWAFDEYLLTITDEYRIKVSPQLFGGRNIPNQLGDLGGKQIILPDDKLLWPDLESLSWHRKKFRNR